MKCPRCQAESHVLRTVTPERRRECISATCGHRFSTTEMTDADLASMVANAVRQALARQAVEGPK